jgi:phosphoglycerol transferase MdoB-like AlkP superfamily enzyme
MNRESFFHLFRLLLRLSLILFIYSLLRLFFYFFNSASVESLSGVEKALTFLYGLRYDISAIIYSNAIIIVLHLLPIRMRDSVNYQKLLKVLYLVVNGFFIALAVADLVYFSFNNKRISSDIFSVGGSFTKQFISFLFSYWYLFLIFFLLIFLLERMYSRTMRNQKPQFSFKSQLVIFLLAMPVFFLGARGGIQKLPLSPVHAAKEVSPLLISYTTNTPFNFIYSLSKRRLTETKWMSDEECRKEFSLDYNLQNEGEFRKKNVVLIILESFSREFIGSLNDYKGYTPFLDSLIPHSYVFDNALASAERSIKAMPAILAGMPSLMNDPFPYSAYQDNCIVGMGSFFKNLGYHTAFFHGGINGEFNFDSFARSAGFDEYYGRNEFNDERYFDGHWGIFDEEFLQYFSSVISNFEQPFCSAVFTVTSHHPFTIPKKYEGRFFKEGNEIVESIGYTDHALKLFFEKAAKQKWFNNTVFIITADHTFEYGLKLKPEYENRVGFFKIPMIIYAPGDTLKGHDKSIIQHTDLLPTILDYLNYSGEIKTFGKSAFKTEKNYAVQYLENIYQIEDEKYCLLHDGLVSVGLYDYTTDFHFEKNLIQKNKEDKYRLQHRLEAILQTYRHTLISNSYCR